MIPILTSRDSANSQKVARGQIFVSHLNRGGQKLANVESSDVIPLTLVFPGIGVIGR